MGREPPQEPDWFQKQIKEAWVLGEGAQADFIEGPLVYINDTATAYKLGPLAADGGRPWCVCDVEEPSWLAEQFPKPWRQKEEGLVLGRLTGANPTHQIHLHFFWIWLWLVHTVHRPAGKVSLLLDCDDVNLCMGPYGVGLATALLSEPLQLPSLPEPLVVDRIKFGIGGTFPFSLWEMQPWGGPSPDYVSMVAAVKAHYHIREAGFATPLRIVISRRPDDGNSSMRVLRNADELAASLDKRGFEVQVVDFGKLSFANQLQAVSNATILAGISGSDLINAVFLPRGAGLVEILPQVRGHQVVNVELHNTMRLAQIVYHRWHSPIDAELLYNESGHLLGNTLLRMIGNADVDIPGATAALEAAALQAAMLQTDRVGEVFSGTELLIDYQDPQPGDGMTTPLKFTPL
ncbi:hypothetical protein WJX73_004083 [Symbiochloris irregularis]|uniref:Glycosyltransferase 61 catalytic domain-containing protein n=1 Tax=Symbiochloris irregularis TaxID=706552 RepID=A0AAW1NTQ1_9CHLO